MQVDLGRYSTMTMQFAPVVFLLASSMKIVSGADWCYQSQVTCNHTCIGPDTWGTVSQTCSGGAQSPVNIVTRRMLLDERLTEFDFTGYQDTFHGRLINNGHTVQLDLPQTIKIEGGNLPTSYKALQLHLHWGKDGGPGSEHTIDGEQFPMEMHIVHIKEEYASLAEAVRDHTGVAVLGFFFEESMSANKKFDPFINALTDIIKPSSNVILQGVSLETFIPPQNSLTRYLRYAGSLTTPDCSEAVVWTIFENTIPLSRNQLSAFSQLQFPEGQQMVKTYRPLQPLNARQVYYSGGHVALVSSVVLIVSVLVSIALSLQAGG